MEGRKEKEMTSISKKEAKLSRFIDGKIHDPT